MKIQPRADKWPSVTYFFPSGHGHLYVVCVYNPKNRTHLLQEIFVYGGQGENPCDKASLEALTRAISVGLRSGIPAQVFIEHLAGISCTHPSIQEGGSILSTADAIAKAMQRFIS